MAKTIGYIRVSTDQQDLQNQQHSILNYANKNALGKVEFIEVKMSSRKKDEDRKIDELFETLQAGDHLIVSELSRIGRSVVNVVTIVNQLIALGVNLHILKEQLFIKPNKQNPFTDFQINIFSAFAQLERDLISKRTKEALQARKEKGIKLGKPVGTIQGSIYDKDKEKIKELHSLGVTLTNISKKHLGYGTIKSLSEYVKNKLDKEK
ncbi:recombinase family protein [Aliarcobacter cryaerophilus]|mgnify:FL=1|uniref:recombinase family protein n=1 Tax=Aliarcobacter TaxID=2321111 RepID=UPI0021B3B8D6|nr:MULTISPECIES: recombinase family protein [Aliarcobacter]MCT7464559.1 recombinase family protein [Aliarcobacter cryaerophilus]MCT7497883.1 recombinase family protein [Aliarcobacter cryaerophilus]MDX4070956.1 recombinase family protein [Aliarcobacter skirrowii]